MRKLLQEVATQIEGEKLYRFVDLNDERDQRQAYWCSTPEQAEADWLRQHSGDQEKA